MTPAEKALLARAIERDTPEAAAVRNERLSPEKRAEFLRVWTDCVRAMYARKKAICELQSLGFVGRYGLGRIWDELETEARRALGIGDEEGL